MMQDVTDYMKSPIESAKQMQEQIADMRNPLGIEKFKGVGENIARL